MKLARTRAPTTAENVAVVAVVAVVAAVVVLVAVAVAAAVLANISNTQHPEASHSKLVQDRTLSMDQRTNAWPRRTHTDRCRQLIKAAIVAQVAKGCA